MTFSSGQPWQDDGADLVRLQAFDLGLRNGLLGDHAVQET
jgi:hypothetical protein